LALAARIIRLSTTFRRAAERLGIRAGSPAYHAIAASTRTLASGELPGAGDSETSFTPGLAFVRRVGGHDLWLLYRFDDEHVFIMTVRNRPPIPAE
jgi:hypothetical protein